MVSLIAAGVAGLAGIEQTAYGAYQKSKGEHQMAGLQDPHYDIPQEEMQKLSMAQRMSLQGMPEQQRQLALQNIQRSSNMGLNQLSSRSAGIAGVGNIVQSQNDAFNNLAAQDTNVRLANQLKYGAALSEMAQYKDKQFGINVVNPFNRKYGMAQNLIGAGTQNIAGGIGTIAGAGMSAAGSFGKGAKSTSPAEYSNGSSSQGANAPAGTYNWNGDNTAFDSSTLYKDNGISLPENNSRYRY